MVNPFDTDKDEAISCFITLLDCVCIRRSQDLLHLPQLVEKTTYVQLTDAEREQYESTIEHMGRVMREQAGVNPLEKERFGIFQAQLQLRILCNHGTFQKRFNLGKKNRDATIEKEDLLLTIGPNAEGPCSVCGVATQVFSSSNNSSSGQGCDHLICPECQSQNTSPAGAADPEAAPCAICQVQDRGSTGSIVANPDMPPEVQNDYFNKEGVSSKISALMNDLLKHRPIAKRYVYAPLLI